VGVVDDRLAGLGLVVPEVVPPVAAYVPAVLDGSRVYVSGQVPVVDGVLAAPGNPGIAEVATCLPLDEAMESLDTLDLVVVGPEAPLVDRSHAQALGRLR